MLFFPEHKVNRFRWEGFKATNGAAVLCTAGAMHSWACEFSHSDSIHFREIKAARNISHHFPNELKVDLLGPFYNYMIRKRVFNHLVNLGCQVGEWIIQAETYRLSCLCPLIKCTVYLQNSVFYPVV